MMFRGLARLRDQLLMTRTGYHSYALQPGIEFFPGAELQFRRWQKAHPSRVFSAQIKHLVVEDLAEHDLSGS